MVLQLLRCLLTRVGRVAWVLGLRRGLLSHRDRRAEALAGRGTTGAPRRVLGQGRHAATLRAEAAGPRPGQRGGTLGPRLALAARLLDGRRIERLPARRRATQCVGLGVGRPVSIGGHWGFVGRGSRSLPGLGFFGGLLGALEL